jgi:hypothetical protein
MQDRGPELGGLDRVLPAMRHERAPHEDERRKAVEEAELAHGVDHVEVACPGLGALRAAPALRPAGRGRVGHLGAALGMRGATIVRRFG